jgi:hypothetical protein
VEVISNFLGIRGRSMVQCRHSISIVVPRMFYSDVKIDSLFVYQRTERFDRAPVGQVFGLSRTLLAASSAATLEEPSTPLSVMKGPHVSIYFFSLSL